MSSIDLRSDTVTRPTEAMRRAMVEAPVGDDVYGEDPTAHRLEARAAEILGKEAAVFTPTGTMANQIALALHCRPGDEVVVGVGAHLVLYEVAAGAALAGVQFVEVGEGGLFGPEDLEAAIKPDLSFFPETTLVAMENTHNRGGGRVFPQEDIAAIAELARSRGLGVHLDGARIWNAAAATGRSEAELSAPADTVTACFSKGLGAPVGSVLAGSAELIWRARRIRRRLGGGMRQVGVLCAAALHALEHHRARIVEDHAHARLLAEGVDRAEGLRCELSTVETNIVNFEVEAGAAQPVVDRAARKGVLVSAVGPSTIRAVTHIEVSREQVERSVELLGQAAAG